ncbi:salicylate synthase [Embleya sp. NPDC059259]|uniref:salicylate synthase n=1 Tax=unclassified Embleya TaxID=2699296 RepID=UPI0036929AEC
MPIDSPTTTPTRRYLRARREGTYDPAGVAVALAESGLFDESLVYERDARWWFAGGAVLVLAIHHDTVTATHADEHTSMPWTRSPARAIDAALRRAPVRDWRLYGHWDFELGAAIAGLPSPDGERALGRLTVPRVEVEIDAHTLTVRALDPDDLERVLRTALAAAPRPIAPTRPVDVEAGEPARFTTAAAAAVEHIRAGELDKLVLSRSVPVPYPVDFPATYLRGRRANTPARSFLLDLPGLRAAGFSPTTLVEIDADARITTRPLAGTCPRDGDPAFDARRRTALLRDAKEVYEHAVSVHQADTELRALCEPDSVTVDAFTTVEEHGSVHHLGSRVHGRLDPRHGPWDALVALFPAGTASGIPKTTACSMIAGYEDTPRGLYAGVVVRATHAGELDAALALRMVYTRDGGTWLRVGAGIVADSRPVREYRDTCHTLAAVAPHVVPQVVPHPRNPPAPPDTPA